MMTPERKRIAVLLAVLGAAAVIRFLVWQDEAAPASGRKGPDRRASKGAPAAGIPDVRIAPLVRPSPIGPVDRNVFRFYDAPTATPTHVPPTPTPPCVPGMRCFIGPLSLAPTPTPTPIVPPAIPYTAVGVFGPKDGLIVTFEHSGRLINAREGDVLDGQFVLRKVNLESVDIGFTNLPPQVIKRIPVGSR